MKSFASKWNSSCLFPLNPEVLHDLEYCLGRGWDSLNVASLRKNANRIVILMSILANSRISNNDLDLIDELMLSFTRRVDINLDRLEHARLKKASEFVQLLDSHIGNDCTGLQQRLRDFQSNSASIMESWKIGNHVGKNAKPTRLTQDERNFRRSVKNVNKKREKSRIHEVLLKLPTLRLLQGENPFEYFVRIIRILVDLMKSGEYDQKSFKQVIWRWLCEKAVHFQWTLPSGIEHLCHSIPQKLPIEQYIATSVRHLIVACRQKATVAAFYDFKIEEFKINEWRGIGSTSQFYQTASSESLMFNESSSGHRSRLFRDLIHSDHIEHILAAVNKLLIYKWPCEYNIQDIQEMIDTSTKFTHLKSDFTISDQVGLEWDMFYKRMTRPYQYCPEDVEEKELGMGNYGSGIMGDDDDDEDDDDDDDDDYDDDGNDDDEITTKESFLQAVDRILPIFRLYVDNLGESAPTYTTTSEGMLDDNIETISTHSTTDNSLTTITTTTTSIQDSTNQLVTTVETDIKNESQYDTSLNTRGEASPYLPQKRTTDMMSPLIESIDSNLSAVISSNRHFGDLERFFLTFQPKESGFDVSLHIADVNPTPHISIGCHSTYESYYETHAGSYSSTNKELFAFSQGLKHYNAFFTGKRFTIISSNADVVRLLGDPDDISQDTATSSLLLGFSHYNFDAKCMQNSHSNMKRLIIEELYARSSHIEDVIPALETESNSAHQSDSAHQSNNVHQSKKFKKSKKWTSNTRKFYDTAKSK